MKILRYALLVLRYALLGLTCLLFTAGKYGNIPTNGQIGIVIVNSKGEVIGYSDKTYIDKYTYSTGNNGKFILRIPDIDTTNSESFWAIKDWIEWIEGTEGIDICEKITIVPNEKYPEIDKDACFTFKKAKISIDKNRLYKSKEKNIRILTIVL